MDAERKRAARQGLEAELRARQVAAPLRRKMEDWQHRAAHLRALHERSVRLGAEDQIWRERARTLAGDVSAELAALEQQMACLPANVVASSTLTDVVRGLHQIIDGLAVLAAPRR